MGTGRADWRWRAGLGTAGLALLAAGVAAGWALKPAPRLSAAAYGGERAYVINAHLHQAPDNYGFLAGDSLMEHALPELLPCGRELINGGVNGAKVADYLALLDRLHFPRRPKVAVLSTGLNDLQLKYDPTGRAALARFRANAAALIDRLGQGGAAVVVVAVPPVSREVGAYFDTASFRLYGDTLEALCRERGCTFVDPFAALREPNFWQAKPGTTRDGLHVDDLRGAYRTIAAELCGGRP